MSYTNGRSYGTGRVYQVRNNRMTSQTLGMPGETGCSMPGKTTPLTTDNNTKAPGPTIQNIQKTPNTAGKREDNNGQNTTPGTPQVTSGNGTTAPRTIPGSGLTTPASAPGNGMTTPRATPNSNMTTPRMAPGPRMTTPRMAPGNTPYIPGNTVPDTGMQLPPSMNNNQEMPNMQQMFHTNRMSQMPNMGYPDYYCVPNMYLPNGNSYGAPMGVPLYPLYGYDNSADLDKDIQYLQQLYPNTAKTIQKEVANECDQMEYDGSMMFDEYPDKEYINKIVTRIYDKVNDSSEEPQVEMKSLYLYPVRKRNNYLHELITLVLLSELFNRRRRYRSRKRWF